MALIDGARLVARPDRHARRPGAARQRLGLPLDLVPPRAEVWLAPPPAPPTPSKAEDGPSHDAIAPIILEGDSIPLVLRPELKRLSSSGAWDSELTETVDESARVTTSAVPVMEPD
jgi:hypothetical protein